MRPYALPMSLGVGAGLDPNKVFGTNIYTGNASARTFDFPNLEATGNALHWSKRRDSNQSNYWFDTVRGLFTLIGETTAAQSASGALSNLRTNGFTATANSVYNQSGALVVNWSFLVAPRFFDIVVYTGNGVVGRAIPHNLRVRPGMVVVKRISSTGDWTVNHISRSSGTAIYMNSTNAESAVGFWNSKDPTDSAFFVDASTTMNASGSTYVAYIFAHDPTPSGIIQCGQYFGNSSATGPIVNLGWEPQWILIKCVTTNGNWFILDNKRGITSGNDAILYSDIINSESSAQALNTSSSGFNIQVASTGLNQSTHTYVYMAIRKGI